MAKIKIVTLSISGEDVEHQRFSFNAGWECKMSQPHWTVWQYLTNLNVVLEYNPAVMFLNKYLMNLKLFLDKNIHMNVYNGFFHYHPKTEK